MAKAMWCGRAEPDLLKYHVLLFDADIFYCLRKEIIARGLSQEENRQIFYDLINSHILEAMGRKDWNEVATILNKITGTQLSSEDVIEIISQTSSPSTGEA